MSESFFVIVFVLPDCLVLWSSILVAKVARRRHATCNMIGCCTQHRILVFHMPCRFMKWPSKPTAISSQFSPILNPNLFLFLILLIIITWAYTLSIIGCIHLEKRILKKKYNRILFSLLYYILSSSDYRFSSTINSSMFNSKS